MRITFKQKGNFKKTDSYLNKISKAIKYGFLDKYGREGVNALKNNTPVDTGLTAMSWEYRIERKRDSVSLVFINTNLQNGIPIAIILQYGHATRNGGYVQGRDYINPAIQPIFDKLADTAWAEVSKL